MGLRYKPMAFTEQGVAMLSSVLHSNRAIEVNILIMRAFVQLRKMIASHDKLARKLAGLEQHLESHDEQIQAVFEAIRKRRLPMAKKWAKEKKNHEDNQRHAGTQPSSRETA
jgi:hypothetical protein